MNTGLLWFDDNPTRTLADKVRLAAARHRRKYGHSPNLCYVHPSALDREMRVDGVRVEAKGNVLRGHLWIGRDNVTSDA